MTNEEKAIKLAAKYFPVGTPHYTTEVAAQVDCQRAINEMAEWKDQQFKEYLEMELNKVLNKRNNAYHSDAYELYDIQASAINDIINKFFKD